MMCKYFYTEILDWQEARKWMTTQRQLGPQQSKPVANVLQDSLVDATYYVDTASILNPSK